MNHQSSPISLLASNALPLETEKSEKRSMIESKAEAESVIQQVVTYH